MDWNRIEGNWKQFKGSAKEKWAKLTDDDVELIGGKKDRLMGVLKERYGHARDVAEREIDGWIESLRPESDTKH